MTDHATSEREIARMRRLVLALLAVGIAVLVALVVLAVRMMTPQGLDVRATNSGGMRWVRSIYGYGPSDAEQLRSPTDVAVGQDGTIWVTDPSRGRVLGFSPSGGLRRIVGSLPATGHPRVLMRPEGVGVGEDGSVYVADYGRGAVLRFDRSGRVAQEWRVPSPMDVAAHRGRVAVSTLYGLAIIERDGAVKTLGKRGRGIYDFDVAHGVAFGPDGEIFVADTQNGRVKAYEPDGTLRWVAAGIASRGATASVEASISVGTFELAAGVAIDGAGRVVFCDPFGPSLVVLDAATGRELAKHGEMGSHDGRMLYPSGVAYDARRDRFAVADTRNGRVQVFELPGSSGSGPTAPASRRLALPVALGVAACLVAYVLWSRAKRRAAR